MAVGLLGAAVCGFMRSMPLEAPQLKTQVLDLSGAPSWALGLGGCLGVGWLFSLLFLSELGRFEFSLELGRLGIFVGIPGLETKRNKKLELLALNFDGESSAGLK